MKKVRQRRKTLSHADIENFLGDLHQNWHESRDNDMNQPNSRNTNNNKQILSNIDLNINKINVNHNGNVTGIVARLSEEDLIREYSRGLYSGKFDAKRERILSKTIYERTNYALIPHRRIYPDQYPHPIKSVDSKRQLLINLQPMLSKSEIVRKTDSNNCVNFTRCSVQRGHKSMCFEYIDMDTGIAVDYDDYERRYLMHIDQVRISRNEIRRKLEQIKKEEEEKERNENNMNINNINHNIKNNHNYVNNNNNNNSKSSLSPHPTRIVDISKSNKTITAQDINDNTHNTNNNTSNNNLENTPNCSPVAMLSKSSHSKLNTSTKNGTGIITTTTTTIATTTTTTITTTTTTTNTTTTTTTTTYYYYYDCY